MWTQRACLSWLLVPLGATARNHRVMNLVLRLCKAAVTAAIPLLAPLASRPRSLDRFHGAVAGTTLALPTGV